MKRQTMLRMAGLLLVVAICGVMASSAWADQLCLAVRQPAGTTSQCSYRGSTAKSDIAGRGSSAHVCVELKNPQPGLSAKALALNSRSNIIGQAVASGSSVCEDAPYAVDHLAWVMNDVIIE